MRNLPLIAGAFFAAACTQLPAEPAAAPAWRPAPVAGAPDPAKVIADAPASAWRDVAPENLLLIELAGGGRVAIELAPEFAPVHVANIRAFARSGHWAGSASLYRSQDNYVVQWGNDEIEKPMPAGVLKLPPAEYDRALAGLPVRAFPYPDSYAPATGHALGWPVAYDPVTGRAWLPHCYATVGVGRDLAPDTGSGSELYAVMGHAPRHLDLNIATVGRVIEGFEHMTQTPRGSEALGFIPKGPGRVPIARVMLAADLPTSERPAYQAMRTDSTAFADYLTGRANRSGDFFKRPAGGLDLCNAPVPVRRRP